jgi:Tfp pilus assembly protein PilX
MKHKPMKSIDFRNILPKGSVLVFSLLILSIMLVTSLTILSSAVLDRKASLSTGSSARSFQVADSGVEEVLYQVYKGSHATLEDVRSAIDNANATCANGVIEFPVAGGTAKVTFYQDETTVYAGPCSGGTATDWRDKVVKIKSEGTAGPTTRAVEVAVAAAGGGITGGCFIDTTAGDLDKNWGTGCKSAGTPWNWGMVSSGEAECTAAAAVGYECGNSSDRGDGVFCICTN